jgi:hypothetical protein
MAFVAIRFSATSRTAHRNNRRVVWERHWFQFESKSRLSVPWQATTHVQLPSKHDCRGRLLATIHHNHALANQSHHQLRFRDRDVASFYFFACM